MESINFEIFRKKPDWQPLADLGGFAERYARADPVAALVKLRSFGEVLVTWIYNSLQLPRPFKATFHDLLINDAFQAVTPRVVLAKLHAVRKEGNRAAHGETIEPETSLWLLREAFDLGCWLFLTFGGGTRADLPTYTEPADVAEPSAKAVAERLAVQEAQMQQLLEQLEATRLQTKSAEESLAVTLAQQQAATAGAETADALHFDEATTRRVLIDRMLAEMRWDVGKNRESTDEVRQELEIGDQPTPSRKGNADYGLFGGDGRPLAVIEAKKTASDPEAGRTQAKLYADGLEKQYGVRPFIYYTNGYEIWFWNDGAGEPPRRVYGFHSKDTLQYRRFQQAEREPRANVVPSPGIIDRLYQHEAVRRVVERFAEQKRRALLVQATGTGKTRVAIALCEALIRARWARRILFLCDRRELRKQANNAFKEFLPGEPRTFVTAETAGDRDKRIYLATYPAMMRCYQTFDVGFFDLVIADESHRSIYNRYRELFEYFDACQVGLTATPVKDAHGRSVIPRDTFRMFGCEADDPTFNYGFPQAVEQGYLVPFEVEIHTTPFLREGIKYSTMSAEQREQLEADDPDPASVEYDPEAVDKRVFNKDTNRLILRNLMERGVKDASGSRVGKTIVFARNHNHAILLQNLFEEMYPQYGGNFCRVIDNYDPRAEELIDDFKGQGSNPDLTIAISVDMLDTGIDVPEVVNLVFAKPVYSYAKFWQMIGRGTRLCLDLFGLGKHKEKFLIFDHWKNFEWFDEQFKKPAQPSSKSLMQLVFEGRVRLAEEALAAQDLDAFQMAIDLIAKDITSLPERSIAVREKWREVASVSRPEVLREFDATTRATLLQLVAPLMQWVNISGHEEAYQLDKLICDLQTEKLRGSGKFDDLRTELIDEVSRLRINLSQVTPKVPLINRVKSAEFWASASVKSLEEVRNDLRGVMRFRLPAVRPGAFPRVLDIKEDVALVERKRHVPRLAGLELVAYRNRVQKVLNELFEANATLQKIKAGEPVSEGDLQALVSLVLTQEPDLDLTDLMEYYPETAGHLDAAIRGIIGLDAQEVEARFIDFVQKHRPTAQQVKFLDLLKDHIRRYGSIEVADLYEPPFTLFHSEGLDGIFEGDLATELIAVISSFAPSRTATAMEGTQP